MTDKKIDIWTFQPFIHDGFECKQFLLGIAREEYKDADPHHPLASAFIYVNAVDYIASHLLTNLRTMSHLIMYWEMNAAFFIKPVDAISLPLGDIIKRLEEYEFYDKGGFLQYLKEFKKLRNKYVHNFLSVKMDEIKCSKVDSDLAEIKDLGERLMNKYDVIVKGMKTAWFAYRDSLVSKDPLTPEIVDKK